MSLIISTLLHENLFGSLLILAGITVLLRQRHLQASVALLFFISGWFVTEIPLRSEYPITQIEKFTAQGLVSLILICAYVSLDDVTKPLLVACTNEVILIGINIASMLYPISPWNHWFLFGVINWISLIALCYNYGRKDRVSAGTSSRTDRAHKAGMYAGRGHNSHGSKISAMAKAEK